MRYLVYKVGGLLHKIPINFELEIDDSSHFVYKK